MYNLILNNIIVHLKVICSCVVENESFAHFQSSVWERFVETHAVARVRNSLLVVPTKGPLGDSLYNYVLRDSSSFDIILLHL